MRKVGDRGCGRGARRGGCKGSEGRVYKGREGQKGTHVVAACQDRNQVDRHSESGRQGREEAKDGRRWKLARERKLGGPAG